MGQGSSAIWPSGMHLLLLHTSVWRRTCWGVICSHLVMVVPSLTERPSPGVPGVGATKEGTSAHAHGLWVGCAGSGWGVGGYIKEVRGQRYMHLGVRHEARRGKTLFMEGTTCQPVSRSA